MNRMLVAGASLIVSAAGCSALEFPRVSGEQYYSALASSYSPVVLFRERRLEGDGLCFYMHGGKAMWKGFVADADVASAAKRAPGLRREVEVFEQAFMEGAAEGMADVFSQPESATRKGHDRPSELDVPVDFRDCPWLWRQGRWCGYDYGKGLARHIRGWDAEAEAGCAAN